MEEDDPPCTRTAARSAGNSRHPQATFCRRWKKLIDRIDWRKGEYVQVDKAARVDALRQAWDPEAQVFRCAYTGIALSETHPHPAYLVFEHRVPGDQHDIVVAAHVINCMKASLDDSTFRRLVLELADAFGGADRRNAIQALVYGIVPPSSAPDGLIDDENVSHGGAS